MTFPILPERSDTVRLARELQRLFAGHPGAVPVYAEWAQGARRRRGYFPELLPCPECAQGPGEWQTIRHVSQAKRQAESEARQDHAELEKTAIDRIAKRAREAARKHAQKQHQRAPDGLAWYEAHAIGRPWRNRPLYRGTFTVIPGDPPTTRLIAWDLDDHGEPGKVLLPDERMRAIADTLIALGAGAAYAVNTSRGGKGRHVRLCVAPTTPAWLAREIGLKILERSGVAPAPAEGTPEHAAWRDRFGDDPAAGVEVFPKQGALGGQMLGSLLALPCSRPLLEQDRAVLLRRDGTPIRTISESARFLAGIVPLALDEVQTLARRLGLDPARKPVAAPSRRPPRRPASIAPRGREAVPEEAKVRDALGHVSADGYDEWIRIGLALKEWGGDEAYHLWDAWSRTSAKYVEEQASATWESLDPRGDVTVGTLFFEARQGGWAGYHPGGARPYTPTATRPPSSETVPYHELVRFVEEALGDAPPGEAASLLAAAPGRGKTYALVEVVVRRWRTGARTARLVTFVDNHEFGEELLLRIRSRARAEGVVVDVAKLPEFRCDADREEGTKWRTKRILKLWDRRYSGPRVVCRDCPRSPTNVRRSGAKPCGWMSADAMARGARVLIVPKARLRRPSVWTSLAKNAEYVVLEEDVVPHLAGVEVVNVRELAQAREFLEGLRVRAGGTAVAGFRHGDLAGIDTAADRDRAARAALQVVGLLASALARTGEEAVELEEAGDLAPLREPASTRYLDAAWHGLARGCVDGNLPRNLLPAILAVADLRGPRVVLRDVYAERGGRQSTVTIPVDRAIPQDRTVLVLDATADRKELEHVLGRKVRELRCGPESRCVTAVQLVDRDWSRKRLKRPGELPKALRLVQEIAARYGRGECVGVVTLAEHEQGVKEAFRDNPVSSLHFGALRGTDSLAGIELLIVLGTPRPPKIVLQRRALLRGATLQELVQKPRLEWVAQGGRRARVLRYDGPMGAAHEATVHAELLQAAGRLSRGPNARGLIFLLSPEPVRLPVPTWRLTQHDLGLDAEAAPWWKASLEVAAHGGGRRAVANRLGVPERLARRLLEAHRVDREIRASLHDGGARSPEPAAAQDRSRVDTVLKYVLNDRVPPGAVVGAEGEDLASRCREIEVPAAVLAKYMGLRADGTAWPPQTVAHYLAGRRPPPPAFLLRAAEVEADWNPSGEAWNLVLACSEGPPRVITAPVTLPQLLHRLEIERARRKPRRVRVKCVDGSITPIDPGENDVRSAWRAGSRSPLVFLESGPVGPGWYDFDESSRGWVFRRRHLHGRRGRAGRGRARRRGERPSQRAETAAAGARGANLSREFEAGQARLEALLARQRARRRARRQDRARRAGVDVAHADVTGTTT